MRKSRLIRYITVYFILSLALVYSCRKEEEGAGYTYYVSSEPIISYTTTQMKGLIDFASATLPDLAQMKPLIKSDIDVFKVVYKTEIKGEKINASAMVCFPANDGTYPVLSFQNGTNTLYSNAPSEAATGLTYQLIELVSSMGYIVVVSDYPGFGESTNVVHPYLVKDPTVSSTIDLYRAVMEMTESGEPGGITAKNDFYLIGYSQGGWATLALHKAMELDYSNEFNLMGSVCGAGPYNISLLFSQMTAGASYPVPAYLAYIVNAYKSYSQFTNPVTDIFNEPYASRIPGLFNGLKSIDQISSQLTTSITGLLTPGFLAGYKTDSKYETVRSAMERNSIVAWKSFKPLFFVHGGSDTQVNRVSTDNIVSEMIAAGTQPGICTKLIVPGADHGDGLVPCMIQGILFLNSIKDKE